MTKITPATDVYIEHLKIDGLSSSEKALIARIEADGTMITKELAEWQDCTREIRSLKAEIERLRGLCGNVADRLEEISYDINTSSLTPSINKLNRASKGEPHE